jgi:hypothetical protein
MIQPLEDQLHMMPVQIHDGVDQDILVAHCSAYVIDQLLGSSTISFPVNKFVPTRCELS